MPNRVYILRFAIAAITCVASIPSICSAASTTIGARKDNTLFNSALIDNVTSNGAGPLFAGRTGGMGPGAQRALLEFDIAGTIPAGSIITDVELTLNILQAGGGSGNDSYTLHRVEQDWGEGTSNLSGGAGANATTNDATWFHTFFDTGTWTNPGGDFSASASASAEIGIFGPANWGSTPELVADVQAWLDDPSLNYGWILIGNESTPTSSRQFASRESASGTPALTVTYVVPEPGTVVMCLVASVVGICTSRRH